MIRKMSPKRTGAEALAGSAAAKRLAVGILEVLSGVCGPVEGSRQLGVSLPRYYALETRGLQGLLHALEPRPRGARAGADTAAARREHQRLEREVLRLQALVRATQRAVALAPPPKDSGPRRRRTARAGKVIAQLRASSTAESSGSGSS